MATLHALRHVSSAIHHAEGLADEADDLGVAELATRLRAHGRVVLDDLEQACRAIDDVEPARLGRERSHEVLTAVYNDVTLQIERLLSPEQSSRLSPGGHLDVVERARYRLRRMPERGDSAYLDVRALLERAVFHYDTAVDGYLSGCADAQTKKDRALVMSQALRLELERAKHTLLVRAEPQSDAWRRIKRRTVRTKRARWLDDAKAQRLLASALAS